MRGDAAVLDLEIARFEKYGHLRLKSAYTSTAKKIRTQHLENLKVMRATYLMELEALRFDGKSVLNMFENMFKEPLDGMIRFSVMDSQRISMAIGDIVAKPEKFGESVSAYFSRNDRNAAGFAYGAFPAVFGYFTSAEFCKSAERFLLSIFGLEGPTPVSEAFMVSFFCSCHSFYDALWHNLAKELAKGTENGYDFEQIFMVMKRALERSVEFLSKCHVSVFSSFCAVAPHSYTNMFVRNLLRRPFLAAVVSSSYFVQGRWNALMTRFFQELSQPDSFARVDGLVDMMIMSTGSLHLQQSMNLRMWKNGIPIVVSDQDVRYLDNVLALELDATDIASVDACQLYVIDVFPKIVAKGNVVAKNEVMFGIAPPEVGARDDGNNEIYMRRWNRMKEMSKNVSGNATSFVLSKLDDREPDFAVFCRRDILMTYKERFYCVEDLMQAVEHLKYITESGEVMLKHNSALYHRFVFRFFQIRISSAISALGVVQSVFDVVAPPKSACFELSCIALDCVVFEASHKLLEAERRFMRVINRWIEVGWPCERTTCGFVHRVKHVLDISMMFGHIQSLSLGKILKILVEFQLRLNDVIDKSTSDPAGRLLLFKYAMYAAQSPYILGVFLMLHHRIFADSAIPTRWPNCTLEAWAMFSSGMWSIIQADETLCAVCADHSDYASLFV